ncbi:hypothetical protein M406DRAFT_256376, partial [Cryphonectria parasitica EP155]
PKNIRNIKSFLRYINFYKQFIKNYSWIAYSLTNLTKKNVMTHPTCRSRKQITGK